MSTGYLRSISPSTVANIRWISFLMILGEKLEREENLEKKRKFSKEREKSQKKENFFRRDFFSRENSLFTFLSTSNAFSTSSNSSKSSNTSNVSIFTFVYIFPGRFREKFMKREFSLKKSLLEKILFFIWDFSLSLENSLFFSRFLSICKFSFKISLMKPSLCIIGTASLQNWALFYFFGGMM